jgi:hypothetical protein
MNTVMNLQVSQNSWDFFTGWATTIFLRMAVIQGVT